MITSGSNTIGFDGAHYDVDRERYLRLLCACDVGVFLPRCGRAGALRGRSPAARPALPDPPGGRAGRPRRADRPADPGPRRLPAQVRERATARQTEAKAAYETLARFDLNYFGIAWGDLLAKVA